MPYVENIDGKSEWSSILLCLDSLLHNDTEQAAMEASIHNNKAPSRTNATILLKSIIKCQTMIDEWYGTNTDIIAQFIQDVHGANAPVMNVISQYIEKLGGNTRNAVRGVTFGAMAVGSSKAAKRDAIIGLNEKFENMRMEVNRLLDQYEELARTIYLPAEVNNLFNQGFTYVDQELTTIDTNMMEYKSVIDAEYAKYDPKHPRTMLTFTKKIDGIYEKLVQSGKHGVKIRKTHDEAQRVVKELRAFTGGGADVLVDINRFLELNHALIQTFNILKPVRRRLSNYSHEMRNYVSKTSTMTEERYFAILHETNYLVCLITNISMWFADYYDVAFAALQKRKLPTIK